MTFAVLPRRDTNPVMPDDRVTGPQSFIAGTTAGFTRPALDAFGLRTVDPATGHVELEPSGYVENSLGAVQGGAVALGHPIGASGARIVASVVQQLRQRGGGLGIAAICSGGGQGDALLVRVT